MATFNITITIPAKAVAVATEYFGSGAEAKEALQNLCQTTVLLELLQRHRQRQQVTANQAIADAMASLEADLA